jgi:hypothetical protein
MILGSQTMPSKASDLAGSSSGLMMWAEVFSLLDVKEIISPGGGDQQGGFGRGNAFVAEILDVIKHLARPVADGGEKFHFLG